MNHFDKYILAMNADCSPYCITLVSAINCSLTDDKLLNKRMTFSIIKLKYSICYVINHNIYIYICHIYFSIVCKLIFECVIIIEQYNSIN